MKTCKYKSCNNEVIQAKHGLKEYCSDKCKNKRNYEENFKGADTLKCRNCKTPFKRKSAKDILCTLCKSRTEVVTKVELPQMDENASRAMIDDWIKNPKNKVKVA